MSSSNMEKQPSILVVCMGNICRSPTGEAVLRAKAEQKGILVTIDSAGTHAYHQGETPDERARAAGEKRGYDFSGIYARQVTDQDFLNFDLILAADNGNYADLMKRCPITMQHKVRRFLELGKSKVSEIPDPYYGGHKGFEYVLDLVEMAADEILEQVQKRPLS